MPADIDHIREPHQVALAELFNIAQGFAGYLRVPGTRPYREGRSGQINDIVADSCLILRCWLHFRAAPRRCRPSTHERPACAKRRPVGTKSRLQIYIILDRRNGRGASTATPKRAKLVVGLTAAPCRDAARSSIVGIPLARAS